MNLQDFDKSSKVAPLLVRLHDKGMLQDVSRAKAELTSVVAELLKLELSVKEQDLVAGVLIDLMRQAEKDLRQALAEYLSAIENVPPRLVLHLANDELSVACPILVRSPVLGDTDLIYIINSKGPAYWQAVARRFGLSEQLIDVLSDKRDPETAVILVKNDSIQLTSHALEILVEMAKECDMLAKPLLLRLEVPASVARMLYQHVGQEIKDLISAYYGIMPVDIDKGIDDLLIEFTEPEKLEYMPTSEMVISAGRFVKKRMLTLQLCLSTVKRGQIAYFIALFSRYTEISLEEIYDALQRPSGRKLALICRALGIQKSDFSIIYVMTERIRSEERSFNQKALNGALEGFDKIRPEIAREIVDTNFRSGRILS